MAEIAKLTDHQIMKLLEPDKKDTAPKGMAIGEQELFEKIWTENGKPLEWIIARWEKKHPNGPKWGEGRQIDSEDASDEFPR